jgi:hypothetical protein
VTQRCACPFCSEDLKRYDGLDKEQTGPVFRVLSRILKKLAGASLSVADKDFARYMPAQGVSVCCEWCGSFVRQTADRGAELLARYRGCHLDRRVDQDDHVLSWRNVRAPCSARNTGAKCVTAALKNESGLLYPLKNALVYMFKVRC